MCVYDCGRTAEDLRKSCMGSSAYLISVSLVLLALKISNLKPFFCNLSMYIWGAFFIVWLYSLFDVVESVRPSCYCLGRMCNAYRSASDSLLS